jgi:large subunit ribosomal protein L22
MESTHNVRAHVSQVSVSAQKVRLILGLVRGKKVIDALNLLKYTPNGASLPVSKLISSAAANAEENFGLSRDDLYIYRIFADEAPTRKWRRFGARGRFKPILRRSSHVTVILREEAA